MIEDVMNICTDIINAFQSPWTKTEQVILHTVKDKGTSFVQIEALNRSHTAIFKIRAKQSDLGLIFKYPCIYEFEDVLLRKWKLKRMDFCNILMNGELYEKLGRERLQDLFLNFAEEFGEND